MLKNSFLAAVTVALLASLAAPLAIAQQERDAVEVIRSQIATKRQALVAENMQLSETESDKFWPVYRDYQFQRSELADQRVANITNFRDNFQTMTNEQAKTIVDDVVKYEEELLKLQKKFIREFRKVLPELKVMRFMQIERKLDAIIDFDLARVIPLTEAS
jgi:hypothetical protein